MKQFALFILCLLVTGNVCRAQQDSAKVIEQQLQAMNRVKMPPYIELNNHKKGTPFKMLLIGNSILWHPASEGIGWYLNHGMAASAPEKDYAHLLFAMTDSMMTDRNITMRISNASDFERNSAFDFSFFDEMLAYSPELLIIQIGDNVPNNEAALEGFKQQYTRLIRLFRERAHTQVVICATPFFGSAEKTDIVTNVALSTQSFLADLSHLPLSDKENCANNEPNYAGDKTLWKVDGIGAHPGDKGMKNIAGQFFSVINACYSQSK